jgi:hypothetical protein
MKYNYLHDKISGVLNESNRNLEYVVNVYDIFHEYIKITNQSVSDVRNKIFSNREKANFFLLEVAGSNLKVRKNKEESGFVFKDNNLPIVKKLCDFIKKDLMNRNIAEIIRDNDNEFIMKEDIKEIYYQFMQIAEVEGYIALHSEIKNETWDHIQNTFFLNKKVPFTRTEFDVMLDAEIPHSNNELFQTLYQFDNSDKIGYYSPKELITEAKEKKDTTKYLSPNEAIEILKETNSDLKEVLLKLDNRVFKVDWNGVFSANSYQKSYYIGDSDSLCEDDFHLADELSKPLIDAILKVKERYPSTLSSNDSLQEEGSTGKSLQVLRDVAYIQYENQVRNNNMDKILHSLHYDKIASLVTDELFSQNIPLDIDLVLQLEMMPVESLESIAKVVDKLNKKDEEAESIKALSYETISHEWKSLKNDIADLTKKQEIYYSENGKYNSEYSSEIRELKEKQMYQGALLQDYEKHKNDTEDYMVEMYIN